MSAPRAGESVSTTASENAMEELKNELAKPRTGLPERRERKRPEKRKDCEEGAHALPCADMTCPCRVLRNR
ncbi:MAG: hypothetical protein SA339_14005 [Methanomassiliicoccus sp.]|nr:hypothetical protein [Methanomassiliicoccus sp.]